MSTLKYNKKGSFLRHAEVSIPLQVVPVGALFICTELSDL